MIDDNSVHDHDWFKSWSWLISIPIMIMIDFNPYHDWFQSLSWLVSIPIMFDFNPRSWSSLISISIMIDFNPDCDDDEI